MNLTNNRPLLLASVAGVALLIAGAGVFAGRTVFAPKPVAGRSREMQWRPAAMRDLSAFIDQKPGNRQLAL